MADERTLASAVRASLAAGIPTEDFFDHLLKNSYSKVRHRMECDLWDYKRSIELDGSGAARIAKDVLAFHNARGGVIIFGVTDEYDVVGIPRTRLCDRVRVHNAIGRYVGPELPYFVASHETNIADHFVLALFVQGRNKAPPRRCLANGPERGGKPDIAREQYFIRAHDESKIVQDHYDFALLFTGFSPADVRAYACEIDEPCFRLLRPHCTKFVGRDAILRDVREALDLRHPIVALEGHGGVGKSAIALELAQRLYCEQRYQYIVSLSAKSSIWTTYATARQADFAGLSEFLCEIGRVFRIDTSPDRDVNAVKADVIDSLGSGPGLLIVDNVEDIADPEVLLFLAREVPAPAKVLLTSRVDRRVGGYPVSVPTMSDTEARELLVHELQRAGYFAKKGDVIEVPREEESALTELLGVTEGLPLALRWSARLAITHGSLVAAVRKFRTSGGEFLQFCMGSMYDALSVNARKIVLSRVYLSESWNSPTIAVATGLDEVEVRDCMFELQERGVLLQDSLRAGAVPQFAPHVLDYLKTIWLQQKPLQEAVKEKLARAIGDRDKTFMSLPGEERADLALRRARQLRDEGDLSQALLICRMGLAAASAHRSLTFEFGHIMFLLGRRVEGIAAMRRAIDRSDKTDESRLLLARDLLAAADPADEREALRLIEDVLSNAACPDLQAYKTFCALVLEHREYAKLRAVVARALDARTDAVGVLRAELIGLSGSALASEVCGDVLKRLFAEKPDRPDRS